VKLDGWFDRCFLALKYGSEAMKVVKPGVKDLTGGSIIMTASGETKILSHTIYLTRYHDKKLRD
jgi:hypothetical protein